jgi:hypothetical protein
VKDLRCEIQSDRGRFTHGRLLSDGSFNTTILAHRCRRGASTPNQTSDFDQLRTLAPPRTYFRRTQQLFRRIADIIPSGRVCSSII